ncbi:hypothetical protein KR018_011193 [Drosophila ironensis]|nr:hypothetical protein KR018_011193 [Drosophila ironensis]
MSLGVLPLFALVCLPLIVNGGSSHINDLNKCAELLNTAKMAFCCGLSFLDKFMFVGTNCTPYWDNYGPCRFQCLYNHWNLLDSENKINRPEFYTMVTELYSPMNGYYHYATAMKAAHETCDSLGTKHADFMLMYTNNMGGTMKDEMKKCQPYAMLHAQCISIFLTLRCPKKNFRPSKDCHELQKVTSECVARLNIAQPDPSELTPQEKTSNGVSHPQSYLLFITIIAMILSQF